MGLKVLFSEDRATGSFGARPLVIIDDSEPLRATSPAVPVTVSASQYTPSVREGCMYRRVTALQPYSEQMSTKTWPGKVRDFRALGNANARAIRRCLQLRFGHFLGKLLQRPPKLPELCVNTTKEQKQRDEYEGCQHLSSPQSSDKLYL